jgi:hypothetical protein
MCSSALVRITEVFSYYLVDLRIVLRFYFRGQVANYQNESIYSSTAAADIYIPFGHVQQKHHYKR